MTNDMSHVTRHTSHVTRHTSSILSSIPFKSLAYGPMKCETFNSARPAVVVGGGGDGDGDGDGDDDVDDGHDDEGDDDNDDDDDDDCSDYCFAGREQAGGLKPFSVNVLIVSEDERRVSYG